MNKEERNTFRKEMLGKLEEQWAKNNRPEDVYKRQLQSCTTIACIVVQL